MTMQTADKIIREGSFQEAKRKRVKKGDRYVFKLIPAHHPTRDQIKRRDSFLAFLECIGQAFFDEAHLMAADLDRGNAFIRISNYLPNAYMRWGLTATPFMRDSYSNLLLEGACGEKLCDISNDFLIKRGYLTPPRIKIVQNCGPRLITRIIKSWQDAYDVGIVLNNFRNEAIVKMAGEGPHPCIILTQQTAHSSELNRLGGFPVVEGKTPVSERRELARKLREGKIKAVVANKVWDEGIDIPELRTVILAAGGKSHVKALQRIGRGLRLATYKNEVVIVDFADKIHPILKRHANMRRKYWDEEGFKIEEI
jgi:superfamily II DNA or RNA helicase